jgi:hypothetical protein
LSFKDAKTLILVCNEELLSSYNISFSKKFVPLLKSGKPKYYYKCTSFIYGPAMLQGRGETITLHIKLCIEVAIFNLECLPNYSSTVAKLFCPEPK